MVFLLAFALLIAVVSSQSLPLAGSASFVRTFWFNDHAYYPHLIVLPDGDIIFAHESDFPTNYDMVVYRLNSRGQVKWARRFGTDENNDVEFITLGTDGQIAIVGRAYYDGSNYGIHLTKLSVEGAIMLSKVYHYEGINQISPEIARDPNGGFVIKGRGKFAPSNQYKTFAIKITNDGDVEWSVKIDDNLAADKNIEIREPHVTSNGDVFLLGYLHKTDSTLHDSFLVKLNSLGQFQWMKTYGFPGYRFKAHEIEQTPDGGFLISVDTYTSIDATYVVKLDSEGNIETQMKYEFANYEWVDDVVLDRDGNYIILTNDDLPPNEKGGALITKYSPSFEVLERRAFVYEEWFYWYHVIPLEEGGYIVGGEAEQVSNSQYHAILIKLEEDFSVCGDLEELDIPQIELTPGELTQTNTADSYDVSFFSVQAYDVEIAQKPFPYTTQRQKEEICEINDASYVSLAQQSNECGCTENGTCDSDTLACSCEAGYVGSMCQHAEANIDQLIASTSSAIQDLNANYPSMAPDEALSEAQFLSSSSDLVTLGSSSSLIDMMLPLSNSGGSPASQDILHSIVKVLSNLSKVKLGSQSDKRELTQTISDITSQIVEIFLDSNPVVQTDQIDIKVEKIPPSQPAIVAPSSEVSIQVPSGVSQCEGGTSKLVAIVFRRLTYSWIMNDNQVSDSPVFSANLYCDSAKQTVRNLSDRIKLEFTVRSKRGLALLARLNSGEITEQQVIDAGFFECRFYDEATDTLSSEGCEVVRITQTSFVCECNHMTNFLSFFNKGAQVLTDSNYDVWLALPQMTAASLKTNIGFYITCTYWCAFFLIGLFVRAADRKHLQGKQLELLFQATRSSSASEELAERGDVSTDASVYPVETFDGKSIFTETRNPKLHTPMEAEDGEEKDNIEAQIGGTGVQHLDESLAIESVLEVNKYSRGKPGIIQTKETKQPPSQSKPSRKNKSGACFRARMKIVGYIKEVGGSNRQRCCCCVCCGMAKREVKEKNMMVGLCTKTSPLYSRCVRLSVVFLGVLTDITMCALFFNLEPIEDSFQFWSNLAENVWVGLYSAILSLPFVLISVLSFRIPSSIIRSFQETTSLKQLRIVYGNQAHRLQCHACIGFTFFFLLSSFLCLYLIAFGNVVSIALQKNWVQSSGASLVIDMIAFEMIPALVFGLAGLLIFLCDCKCCLCPLVSVEVYRVFRNIAA